jgi:glutathione S-transferase
MTKPEVIGSSKSTYTRVVRMVCEEKGIEYTLTETAIFAPELFSVHPLGKMPALRHGDVCLFESKAIATYLDRVFVGPEIFPAAPIPVSLTEQWVSFINQLWTEPSSVRTSTSTSLHGEIIESPTAT